MGFNTNLAKSQIAPIRCENINLQNITEIFPAQVTHFPMKYLGLPLALSKLKKVHVQPLLDKCRKKMAPWQGKLLNTAGRTALTKSVLTAQPIYHMTALKLQDGTLEAIDKTRRKFLWAGGEDISRGKCKVNWESVCRPKELGGLGVLDLFKFARALRLRWLWFEWTAPERPWTGTMVPCDQLDKDLFAAATTITIGDGRMANFWHSHWIEGKSPKSITPAIFTASKRKNITVQEALTSNSWIRDINLLHLTSGDHLRQYVELWTLIHNRTPLGQQRDTITWKLTLTGEYTTKSAYRVQFLGAAKSFFNETIWKCWAPPKCKFFAWLVMQNRVWTADRLKKRGWRNQQYCPLCHTTLETVVHLLAHCRFSQRIWLDIQRWTGLNLNIHNWDRCASGGLVVSTHAQSAKSSQGCQDPNHPHLLGTVV